MTTEAVRPRSVRGLRGDVDAAVAQLGFNLAQAMIPVALLVAAGVARPIAVGRMIPGFASGLLIGSVGLTWLAHRLARRTGRTDVTVHAYGSSVPAILAYTGLIFVPVAARTGDVVTAWRATAGAVVLTGLVKLAAAPLAAWMLRAIPASAVAAVFGAAMYSYLALALFPRLLDQPAVGLLALAIVMATQLAGLGVTRWRIPPFVVAWLVPLGLAIAVGYVRPQWQGLRFVSPVAVPGDLWSGIQLATDALPVVLPVALYLVLQDIAANAAAAAAGDRFSAGRVLAVDGVATVVCGLAGSVVTPCVYAVHGAYKETGAGTRYTWWSAAAFFLLVVAGLLDVAGDLFPWPILAALVAYVAVGVGLSALRTTPRRHHGALLLAFVIPGVAVVSSTVSSATASLGLPASRPEVSAALDASIHWGSVQLLANGFLLLVLVVAAVLVELVDRRFVAAATWCLLAAGCAWFGLLHGARLGWGAQPQAALGWLLAAAVVGGARWWRAPDLADVADR